MPEAAQAGLARRTKPSCRIDRTTGMINQLFTPPI
jgi:hypothetical protein